MLVNLKLALFVLFANVFLLSGFSQVKPVSTPETIPLAVQQAREAIRKVLDDSGRNFKDGMVALKANRRSDSGAAFDRSVETFLMSTLDIQRDKTLQSCFNQLIETVYRIEFPSKSQDPQIQDLVSKCGWKWNDTDFAIADNAVKKISEIAAEQTPLSSGDARQLEERQNVAKKRLDLARSNVEDTKTKLITITEKQKESEFSETELGNARATHERAVSQYLQALNELNKLSLELRYASELGFQKQDFEPSSLDELSKLELTPDESGPDEGWRTISKSTGVSVADLMAANPGMKEPRGRVYVPVSDNRVRTIEYSRPPAVSMSNARIVKAQAGDTIAKLAARNGADPTEVAKYNGLLPNSVLGAGREIKIPPHYYRANSGPVLVPIPKSNLKPVAKATTPIERIGPKPSQAKDGKVGIVMKYFNEVLHDPYSMRIVRWSPITQSVVVGVPCWRVTVKYRAKNLMGAYVLSERVFYIRNNKIVSSYE